MEEFYLLNEGVTYDEKSDKFIYNFDDNSDECIIKFNTTDLVPIKVGPDEVYYFGYEFEMTDYASSKIRTKFFNDLRYGSDGITPDKHKFIVNALTKLHKQINIHKFDVIIYPESRSEINSHIIKIISRVTNIKNKLAIKLLKKLPSEIEFNWQDFEIDFMEKKDVNGNYIYRNSPRLYNQLVENVKKLLEKIRKSDYFSIAETIKKNKYKQYIEPFLYVADDNLKCVQSAKNILLIDDVNTTGSTILAAIKAIRKVNQEAKIVVFSIIGKDFLQKL